jgi:hypothetical protein
MHINEKPLHTEKATVWSGVSTFVMIGLYLFFLFEENNRTVTMDSKHYCTLL